MDREVTPGGITRLLEKGKEGVGDRKLTSVSAARRRQPSHLRGSSHAATLEPVNQAGHHGVNKHPPINRSRNRGRGLFVEILSG